MSQAYSLNGWDICIPGAVPRAEDSQPFGLKADRSRNINYSERGDFAG